jgi:protein TonB
MPSFKKEEKKVCVKLSCVVEKKPTPKIQPKPKPKPIIKKKKIKPKKKPKPKPKKVEIVKKVPVVMPIKKEEIVEPEPEIKEVQKEPEPVPVQEVEEAATFEETQEEVQEDPHAKEQRIAKEYLEENIAKIRQLIGDNLYYPRSARKRGKVGEVIVRFKLLKDSTVKDIEIISSKSDILGRAARKTIENLSGEFPKPKEELTIKVPIDYQLKR